MNCIYCKNMKINPESGGYMCLSGHTLCCDCFEKGIHKCSRCNDFLYFVHLTVAPAPVEDEQTQVEANTLFKCNCRILKSNTTPNFLPRSTSSLGIQINYKEEFTTADDMVGASCLEEPSSKMSNSIKAVKSSMVPGDAIDVVVNQVESAIRVALVDSLHGMGDGPRRYSQRLSARHRVKKERDGPPAEPKKLYKSTCTQTMVTITADIPRKHRKPAITTEAPNEPKQHEFTPPETCPSHRSSYNIPHTSAGVQLSSGKGASSCATVTVLSRPRRRVPAEELILPRVSHRTAQLAMLLEEARALPNPPQHSSQVQKSSETDLMKIPQPIYIPRSKWPDKAMILPDPEEAKIHPYRRPSPMSQSSNYPWGKNDFEYAHFPRFGNTERTNRTDRSSSRSHESENQHKTVKESKTTRKKPKSIGSPPVSFDLLDIPRTPVPCPDGSCRRLMFVTSICQHYVINHMSIVIEKLMPGESKYLNINPRLSAHKKGKCPALYLIRNKVHHWGGDEFHKYYPMLAVSQLVDISDIFGLRLNKHGNKGAKLLMVYLTGLIAPNFPLKVKLSLMMPGSKDPNKYYRETYGPLYSMQAPQDVKHIFLNSHRILLSELDIDKLTHHGRDMLRFKVQVD